MKFTTSPPQERRTRSGQPSLLLDLLSACAAAVLSLLEGITKFATVQMAITGEPFFTAGRRVVALLSRNLMDTAAVWWLPPLVLQSTALIMSVGWGAGVYFLSGTMWSGGGKDAAVDNSSMVLAVVAGAGRLRSASRLLQHLKELYLL